MAHLVRTQVMQHRAMLCGRSAVRTGLLRGISAPYIWLGVSQMSDIRSTLDLLRQHANRDAFATASISALEAYAVALTNSQAFSFFGAREYPQLCETVRVHLLRAHIQALQNHITKLDEKSTRLSWLVIVLTVVATLSAIAQTTVAILPYVGILPNSPTASAPQKPAAPQSAPTPPAPQAAGQPTKKAP